MSTQVQRRKGTTAQHASFTGASAELTVDTTKNTVVVHDGATAGGIPLAKETGSAISATSLSLPNSTTNGVAYVNGSKVVVAGSVLTFDGNDLSVNGITVGKGAAAVSTNTAVGNLVMGVNINGAQNTAMGYTAMKGITTGNANTAFGTVSLWTNSIGTQNTAIGWGSLFPATGDGNTAVGHNAGGAITSGAKNTLIGRFDGNTGGLDIRTASNYIVLSDGDGNPRAWWNGANPTFPGAMTLSGGTANAVAFLDGSKVLTTGTALTFDGTNLGFNNGSSILAASATVLYMDANQTVLRGRATNGIIFQDSTGSEQMRLTSTGLGIGTTSPNAKLQVDGPFIRYGNSASYTSDEFLIQRTAAGMTLNARQVTNMVFLTGDVERARIDASGIFQVSSSATNTVKITTGASIGFTNTTNTSSFDVGLLGGASDATGYVFNRANAGIVFGTNGAEKMRLDASGNLGIGATSPTYKLDVIQDANSFVGQRIRNNDTGSSAYAGLIVNASGNSWGMRMGSSAANSNALEFVLDAAGTPSIKATLDSSGNLGIGTSTPSGYGASYKQLVINGGANPSMLQLNNTTTGQGSNTGGLALIQSGVDSFIVNPQATGSLILYTNNTERARIDASGNLLVGTTTVGNGLGSAFRGTITSASGGDGVAIKCSGATASNLPLGLHNDSASGNNSFASFYTDSSPTIRGSITYNRGAGLVAYNVTSDYRAKDIIGPVVDSGVLIDSVPVYMGKMKGATQERPMFIAHETPAYAHTGIKDAVDADGKPVYQQMDASALIPVMWAEIQDLRKRLAAAGI